MRTVEMEGMKFGRLTVIARNGKHRQEIAWLCECECGNKVTLPGSWLRSGNTKSCGCFRKETGVARGKASRKHGGWSENRQLYNIWAGILSRCRTPTDRRYPNYGGRGITVCDRWLDYANFAADMGDRPSPLHSVDRIDGTLGYSPENCRWATATEQNRNKLGLRLVTVDGETACVTVMVERHAVSGVGAELVYARLARGWDAADALRTPPYASR